MLVPQRYESRNLKKNDNPKKSRIYYIVTSISLTETFAKTTWTAPRSQSRHIWLKHSTKSSSSISRRLCEDRRKQTRMNSPKPKNKIKLRASTCIKKSILLKKSSTHFFQSISFLFKQLQFFTDQKSTDGPSVPLTDLQHWVDSQTHPAPAVARKQKHPAPFLRDGWMDDKWRKDVYF